MNKAILLGSVSALVAAGTLAAGFYAAKPTIAVAQQQPQVIAAAGSDLQQKEIEEIVRNYLLKNPEILVEVQTALEQKQKEEQRVASLQTIQQSKELIYSSAADGVIGNPNGKTTIVEFYDYNCGFCKRAITDMQELVKADPDLRFVLKELPILGPDSQKAHVVAQAFKHLMPEKYSEFHMRLLGGETRATEETAMLVATSLGADEAKMREEMKNPEIQKGFDATYELANKLSITGTPSYVVGDEVVFGALGQDVLREKIASARAACQTAAC
ncbi:MAG: DsbA family protein [Rhizobiaceae bacterium]